jgi:ATP-dependent RNA helicase DeaD
MSTAEGGYVRVYINIGKEQKVNPGRIIELLNSVKTLRDAKVGKILIEDNYSAFDIESGFENDLLSGFRSKQIAGVPVMVSQELSELGERVQRTSFKKDEKPYKKEGGKSFGKDSFDKKKKKKW